MQITNAIPASVLALANICNNHVQGQHKVDCVDKDQVYFYGPDYCSDYWNAPTGDWVDFTDSAGKTANIGQVSAFASKAACEAAFENIVDLCWKSWDAGTWSSYGASLTVNFCRW